MIRIFTYSLTLLLAVSVSSGAQPLKTNLPFHSEDHQLREQSIDTSSLTMNDFYLPQQQQTESPSMGPWEAMQKKAGIALLGSAIIPGLGQAANAKWIRAGTYFLADVALLTMHLYLDSEGENLQNDYQNFADTHWDARNYAEWLINYHDENNITNEHLDELRAEMNSGSDQIDLNILRDVERNTPFVNTDGSVSNNFSHVLPDYGSQQYYELISKYYQYGPGWDDFNTRYQLAWNGSDMSPRFHQGADMSEEFNDKLRLAGNMLGYMLLNHAISAFDAMITVKLKNSRIEAQPGVFGAPFSLKYHF